MLSNIHPRILLSAAREGVESHPRETFYPQNKKIPRGKLFFVPGSGAMTGVNKSLFITFDVFTGKSHRARAHRQKINVYVANFNNFVFLEGVCSPPSPPPPPLPIRSRRRLVTSNPPLIDSSFLAAQPRFHPGRNLINQRPCLWCGAYRANLINEPRLASSASNSLDRSWIRRRRRGIFIPSSVPFHDPPTSIIVRLSETRRGREGKQLSIDARIRDWICDWWFGKGWKRRIRYFIQEFKIIEFVCLFARIYNNVKILHRRVKYSSFLSQILFILNNLFVRFSKIRTKYYIKYKFIYRLHRGSTSPPVFHFPKFHRIPSLVQEIPARYLIRGRGAIWRGAAGAGSWRIAQT